MKMNSKKQIEITLAIFHEFFSLIVKRSNTIFKDFVCRMSLHVILCFVAKKCNLPKICKN